jgi:hypothetical protein
MFRAHRFKASSARAAAARGEVPIEKCATCGLLRRTVGVLHRDWNDIGVVLSPVVRTLFLFSYEGTIGGVWSSTSPPCRLVGS